MSTFRSKLRRPLAKTQPVKLPILPVLPLYANICLKCLVLPVKFFMYSYLYAMLGCRLKLNQPSAKILKSHLVLLTSIKSKSPTPYMSSIPCNLQSPLVA